MVEVAIDKKVNFHVGKKLRERRRSMKITQEILGKKVGVTFQQIQKYERGINRVSCGTLYVISGILEVPITYFFAGFELNVAEGKRRVITNEEMELLKRYKLIKDKDTKELINNLLNMFVNQK